MYESRKQPVLARARFMRRLLRHSAAALGLLAGSLLIGMIGYVAFEDLSWVDAFLNASMLLGGMGPVDPPQTVAGKLFAGLYALYCGLVVLAAVGLLLAPVIHRVMHTVHWDET